MSSLRDAIDNILKKFPPDEILSYSGVTDSNGEFSVSFSDPLSSPPKVVATVKDNTENYTVSSIATVNGFTITVKHSDSTLGNLTTTRVNSEGVGVDVIIDRGENQ